MEYLKRIADNQLKLRLVSPFNNREGFVRAAARYPSLESGSCILITLFAFISAVVVLPHHFGPFI